MSYINMPNITYIVPVKKNILYYIKEYGRDATVNKILQNELSEFSFLYIDNNTATKIENKIKEFFENINVRNIKINVVVNESISTINTEIIYLDRKINLNKKFYEFLRKEKLKRVLKNNK